MSGPSSVIDDGETRISEQDVTTERDHAGMQETRERLWDWIGILLDGVVGDALHDAASHLLMQYYCTDSLLSSLILGAFMGTMYGTVPNE